MQGGSGNHVDQNASSTVLVLVDLGAAAIYADVHVAELVSLRVSLVGLGQTDGLAFVLEQRRDRGRLARTVLHLPGRLHLRILWPLRGDVALDGLERRLVVGRNRHEARLLTVEVAILPHTNGRRRGVDGVSG